MEKKFIKATKEYCNCEKHVAAPYFRRTFSLDFVPEQADIKICGMGFYRLFVNGTEITKGMLAPYISNPDHYCYYDSYDAAPYLKKGKNAIGVILGNGFFNSFAGGVWDFDKGDWRGAPVLALEFFAKAGEQELSFGADEQFLVHPSPILMDEERLGEIYDANREIPGWCDPEFDDGGWMPALSADTPRGAFKLCTAEPIRVMEELKPIRITREGDAFLYDFGENNAGVCRLQIRAKKGQEISLRHAEELIDGKFSTKYIMYGRKEDSHFQRDIYIAKGEGAETHIPSFTYHGFRYVLVEGITGEQATPELLTYLVCRSDLRTIGGFSCSDEMANKIFDICRRSDLSNFYYFPTDCPQREKNGWTGDVSMSADHMARLYDVQKSFREWLCSIRRAQNEQGALPGIVPTAKWGYAWGNGPAWDSVLFNLTYQLYLVYGDLEAVRENAHAMLSYLDYAMSKRNERGTVQYGLGDWAPPGRQNHESPAPVEFTDSVMIMDIAGKCAKMLKAIGNTHGAAYAQGIYEDMRETIRRELVDFSTMTVTGNCQTCQAMAVYYDVLDEDEKPAAVKHLVSLIHENKDHFDCGYLGLHTIFHVLSDFGYAELAYKMVTCEDYPSYGHFVVTGETTVPEHFHPDGQPLGSHNHHFFCDVERWFMEDVAGLHIIDSEHVEIKPNFIQELDSASAYTEIPKGRVSVSWERKGEEIHLNVVSPVAHRLILPEGQKIILNGGAK